MPLLLEKLNNIRALRVISREFTIDVLEDMLAKLRTVTEEKRAEEQAAQAQRAEHQEKLNTWLELMIADGITPEQLVGHNSASSKGNKKRQPRPPKYRFTDHTGAEKTWTGQGRMPKPIARAIEAGATLESFLI